MFNRSYLGCRNLFFFSLSVRSCLSFYVFIWFLLVPLNSSVCKYTLLVSRVFIHHSLCSRHDKCTYKHSVNGEWDVLNISPSWKDAQIYFSSRSLEIPIDIFVSPVFPLFFDKSISPAFFLLWATAMLKWISWNIVWKTFNGWKHLFIQNITAIIFTMCLQKKMCFILCVFTIHSFQI